ncbi:glycosyltransferase family 2 protein [Candidatus Microgenomates bacterium]|nr:glycosyltransferase family 2 protein [Candidatus Microgenomates bacterium CPR3]RIK51521.1 MAG: glycosyltransferase family 2 protein [Candidatus Microgenomates bacterium]
MKNLIIIPAFNESAVIETTLKDLRHSLMRDKVKADILLVDDGSSDNTGGVSAPHVDYLLTHTHNCGLGAALATGIEFARRGGYDACVTFDSDGQHDASDIARALEKLESGYDIVIGSRFVGSHSGMPIFRRVVLFIGNFITFLFFGVWTTDSQSGFRGLSKRAINNLVLKSNRMEVSSEFFSEIHRLSLKMCEIPIHIRYTKYSLGKGQKNTASMGVLIKLLYKVFG